MSDQAKNTPKTDDIFLSPRVVDRQAFNDFAGQLRTLIDQAGAAAQSLQAAAAEAQRTRDGLREAVTANQMKLDMASRALAAIDQKTEQTRRMIDSASDLTSRMDDLRTQADAIIAERTGILCQRVNEAEQAAIAAVDEARHTLAETIDRGAAQVALIESAASGPLLSDLQQMISRAETAGRLGANLAVLIERGEAQERAAQDAVARFEEVHDQADATRMKLSEFVQTATPLAEEVGSLQGHLESTVNEAVRFCQGAQGSMAELVAQHRQSIDADLARVAPTRAELLALIDSAAAARQTANQATGNAERAARDLASLLAQVEPWRHVILGDADQPAGAALNGMILELKHELRGVAGALRGIADRAESALVPNDPIAAPTRLEPFSPVRSTPSRSSTDAAA